MTYINSTSIRQESAAVQNVEIVRNTAMDSLCTFHGRIVKTFSSLPRDGKIWEVVKRILFVMISPLAYISLSAFAIIGYPFMKETITLKKTPVEKESPISQLGKELFPGSAPGQEYTAKKIAAFFTISIQNLLQKETAAATKRLLSEDLSFEKVQQVTVDWTCVCKIGGETKLFKPCSPTDPQATARALVEIGTWLGEHLSAARSKNDIEISGSYQVSSRVLYSSGLIEQGWMVYPKRFS